MEFPVSMESASAAALVLFMDLVVLDRMIEGSCTKIEPSNETEEETPRTSLASPVVLKKVFVPGTPATHAMEDSEEESLDSIEPQRLLNFPVELPVEDNSRNSTCPSDLSTDSDGSIHDFYREEEKSLAQPLEPDTNDSTSDAHLAQEESKRFRALKTKALESYKARQSRNSITMNKQKQQTSAIEIQKVYRSHVAQTSYRRKYRAICTIQHFLRASKPSLSQQCPPSLERSLNLDISQETTALQATKQENDELNSSFATQIQKAYRSHAAQTNYRRSISAIRNIQRFLRASKSSNQESDTLDVSSAIKIQKIYRSHAAQTFYRRNIQASRTIQRFLRASESSKPASPTCSDCGLSEAVTMLQAIYRGTNIRKERETEALTNSSATQIQKTYRSHAARRNYREMCHHASKQLQEAQDDVEFASVSGEDLVARDVAIESSQVATTYSFYPASDPSFHDSTAPQENAELEQTKICEEEATTKIQSFYRSVSTARKYQMLRRGVLAFQKRRQRASIRMEMIQNQSARTIQSAYRMHVARSSYRELIRCVCILQRFAKNTIKDKNTVNGAQMFLEIEPESFAESEYLNGEGVEAVTQIQRIYRGHKTRGQFQRSVRSVEEQPSVSTPSRDELIDKAKRSVEAYKERSTKIHIEMVRKDEEPKTFEE